MTSNQNSPVTKPGATKSPLFFGWYVVAAVTFIAFVNTGSRSSFGIFVIPMSEEFGWNRLTISSVAALGAIVGGAAQPFLGYAFDRVGARKVIVTSLVVVGLATAALGLTFNFIFLLLVFGFVTSISNSGAALARGALLARWFVRKRATVVSVGAVGTSAGSLLLVPFAMFLLQATGGNWRITWAALGLIILVLAVPLGFLFIRDDPSKVGLKPYGEHDPSEDAAADRSRHRRGPLEVDAWSESFRSPPIWQMSGAFFVCGFTTLIMSVHFVPYAIDIGVSPGLAATIFGVMMGLNVLGGLGSGMLADRFGRKNLLAAAYFIRGCGYIALLLAPSTLGLWLFAGFAGMSWIATVSLTNTLTADVYGLRALGTISGITFLCHQIGGLAGVLLGGFFYDLTGAYTLPFAIVGAMLFPAALSAFTINERKYSTRYDGRLVAVAGSGD
ncbi:MAG: hypothetical protein CL755_07025 [Chloroflexi bacterium]|jgi:MFS family permease|nr:hypothetical protein [Chloroflexota bacterium]HIB13744.1 MFS transporter [Dehalococcoidia bacterium]HIM48660.1 MFS transporter [Dehalococcoidia bacterium]|tara:strand:- start:2687 stop:4018 length:1332 start_codon:yes stop_codon:yes gene_type:complete